MSVNKFKVIVIIGVVLFMGTATIIMPAKISNRDTSVEEKRAKELSSIIHQTTEDECLDKVLTSWFDAFIASQEDGMSMFEADKKAVLEATATYNSECQIK